MNKKTITEIGITLVLGVGIGWLAKGVTSQSTPASSTDQQSASRAGSRFFSSSEGSTSVSGNGLSNTSLSRSSSGSLSGSGSDRVSALGDQLRQTGDPLERSRLFDQLLQQLTAENALEMREFIKDLDSDSPEFEMFHYAWGQVAGKEAVFFGLNSPERDGGIVFRGWASANPEEAEKWLTNLDFENDSSLKVLRDRGLSAERLNAFLREQLLHGLYLNDPSKAASYIAGLPEDQANFASRGSEELVEDIISRNGIDAARNWVDLLPVGNLSSRAVGEVADEWSEREPRAALEWAMTHQDDDVRHEAIENVWRNMARGEGGADPFEAAEEINTMTNSSDKDSALAGYADGTRYRYPRTSVDAAMSIGDPQLREESIIRNGGYYLRREPEEARQWMVSNGFSEELVENITRSSRRGGRR